VGELFYVRAGFKALDALFFVVPSNLPRISYIPRLPFRKMWVIGKALFIQIQIQAIIT